MSAKVRYSFLISKFLSDPKEISSLLRMHPTSSGLKGEVKKNQIGQDYGEKNSYWEIEFSNDLGFDLELYVDDVLSVIRNLSQELVLLREQEPKAEMHIMIQVTVTPRSPLPSLLLSPESMGELSCLGVGLMADIN